jgi:hypothetical protein
MDVHEKILSDGSSVGFLLAAGLVPMEAKFDNVVFP